MKKIIAIFSSLAMALVVSLVMVGCSSGDGSGGGTAAVADKKSDFVWFKVEVPDGVTVSNNAGNTCDKANFKFGEKGIVSLIFTDGDSAQKRFDEEGNRMSDAFGWTVKDPETHGDKQWLVATYTHSGGEDKFCITDVNGGSVYLRFQNIEGSDDVINKMLDTIEFPDDIKQAVKDAKQKNLTDVEIKK